MAAKDKDAEQKAQAEAPIIDRQAWRINEFCKKHRISPATFHKYRALGKIRVIRIGRRVLIPAAEALRISTEGLQ